MSFPVRLDQSKRTPMYRQLVDGLRQAILDGQLAPGQNLPSTRELAQILCVSRVTVVRAYEELLSQHYLEAATGRGTRVSLEVGRLVDSGRTARQKRQSNVLGGGGPLSDYGRRLIALPETVSGAGDMAQLYFGAPAPESLPLKQWREVLLRHSRRHADKEFDYSVDPMGHAGLREAIADYLARARAVRCSTDQLAVFSGTQQALNIVARLLLCPGDHVAVENPGFIRARQTFALEGAQIVPIAVDEEGLDTGALSRQRQRIKLCYVTPSHHDPTGAIMPLSRRQELVSWAARNEAFVVEDDYDSEYRYGIPPEPSLQGLDRAGRVFYISSFWKVLYPILPIGFCIVPPDFVDVFKRAKTFVQRDAPLVEQYALTDFIAEGHLERYIRKQRTIFAARRGMMLTCLTRRFQDSFEFITAGMHLLVRFRLDRSDASIIESAARAGLPMASSAPYYVEKSPGGEFLIPFAQLGEADIAAAIDRFADALSQR